MGIAYSQVMGGQAIYGFTIGCSLTAGVMGFELFWVQGKYGNWLRALPLLVFTLVSTLGVGDYQCHMPTIYPDFGALG